jgi:small subunit ribosomal protein S1
MTKIKLCPLIYKLKTYFYNDEYNVRRQDYFIDDREQLDEVEQFEKGKKVEGTITRITPFGAFVQISPAVEALVHISELGGGEGVDPEKVFTLNERKEFTVLDIDKDSRKISLSLADKKAKK